MKLMTRTHSLIPDAMSRGDQVGDGVSRTATAFDRAPRNAGVLDEFIELAVRSLDAEMLAAINRSIPGDGRIVFGTACSGSEMYLVALPALALHLGRALGRPVRFTHAWSCEVVKAKREWIVDQFRPAKVFCNIHHLANGAALDHVSGRFQDVDDVWMIIAGTSCKDASRLNPHHTERLDAVAEGSHTTGSTFRSLAEYVRRKRSTVRVAILENVPELRHVSRTTGRSSFDAVRDVFQDDIEFNFVFEVFDASDVGIPVDRSRLYMAGLAGDTKADQQRCVSDVVNKIVQATPTWDVDSFLLDEYSALDMIADWAPESVAESSVVGLMSGAKWKSRHNGTAAELRAEVLDEVAHGLRGNVWWRSLPERQRDHVVITLATGRVTGRVPVAFGVQSNLGWGRKRESQCFPVVVPSGRTWITGRDRLLLGVEALMLQGCDVRYLPALAPGKYSGAFLQDLAGNAFCVHQFVTWLLAVLVASGME